MKENRLKVQINKPIHEVFLFSITPPNATVWIDFIESEEASEWPIRAGTVYKMKTKSGEDFSISVVDIKENEFVEWISEDKNTHCRYTFKNLGDNATELEYYEWVDAGELKDPFTSSVLQKLKSILENWHN